MDNDTGSLPLLLSYFILTAASGIFVSLLLLRTGLQPVGGLSFASLNAMNGLFFLVAAFSIGSAVLAVDVYRVRIRHKKPTSIQVFFEGVWNRRVVSLAGFLLYVVGVIHLLSASPAIYGPTYPERLIPIFLWMTSLGLLTVICMALYHAADALRDFTRAILLLIILTTGVLVNLQFWSYESPRQEDIYFIYLDGNRLTEGSNPYDRVLSGDMQINNKYSTYLPVFYLLSSAVQRLGLGVFAEWLSFWRVAFLVANLSVAALLYWIPGQQRMTALSVFAALFWLFNRWTLHVSKTADIDFLPLFFLLLSLYLYRRNTAASYLALGLSLGIKQMAVFLVPLYLIWAWRDSHPSERIKRLTAAVAMIGIIPLLSSAPFLVWNWDVFIRSILFSATRNAAASFEVYSLDAVLGLRGIPSRIPMLIMFAFVYWLTWKRSIERYTPAFLTMSSFVFFNPVFFTSYMVWVVALIPLAAYEYIIALKSRSTKEI